MSVRPITDTLRHIGGGAFMDEASDKLAELVNAVDTSGKGGTLTLTISVKKATRAGAMHLGGKVAVKKPGDEPMEALLFATPEGNLISEDPRQAKLDLKRVDAPETAPSELKTA